MAGVLKNIYPRLDLVLSLAKALAVVVLVQSWRVRAMPPMLYFTIEYSSSFKYCLLKVSNS